MQQHDIGTYTEKSWKRLKFAQIDRENPEILMEKLLYTLKMSHIVPYFLPKKVQNPIYVPYFRVENSHISHIFSKLLSGQPAHPA